MRTIGTRRFVIALMLAAGAIVACQRSIETPSAGARQAAEPAAVAATAGRSGQAVGSHAYSCGTAAGVCSCVRISPGLEAPNTPCASSACCFVDAVGQCICRLNQAQLDCNGLSNSLGAVRRLPSCPPP